jgi:hypothetical protein
MKRTLHRLVSFLGVGIASVAVLLLAVRLAEPKSLQKPRVNLAQKAPRDAIANERVNAVQPAPLDPKFLADLSKVEVESPTEKVLAERTAPSTSPPDPEFTNPKAEPGKVRWHKTFAAACAAARRSGKPVLLFQMMGKLDDRFC